MNIIPIILFILLLKLWEDKKYDWGLIIITAFLTNGYGFIPESVFVFKSYDYVIAFLLITSIIGFIKDKSYFNAKSTKFIYLLYLLIAYQVYEILNTLYMGAESLGYIIKVARINFIYLAYFVLRKIPFKTYKAFIKLNLYFCIIQGVFFYLQPLGINLLQGRIDEATSAGQITRYANFPEFTIFYIFYCFYNERNIYSKILYLCFWGGILILAQVRGDITAIAIAFTIYYLLKNKLKYYIALLTFGFLASIVVVPMFQYRDENSRSSFAEDITNILTVDEVTDIKNNSGNFTFRIAMLVERWNYLLENPQYILTGVGCIHEDSPNCYNRFEFIIGTVNEDRYNGYCLIESGDITWVPILLRYGIIGIIIYSLFLIYWIIQGVKYLRYSLNPIYIATALIGFTTTITTINTVLFDSYLKTFMLLFYISYLIRYRKRLQQLLLIKQLIHENRSNYTKLQ